jgi:hypothetical protein
MLDPLTLATSAISAALLALAIALLLSDRREQRRQRIIRFLSREMWQ